MQQTDLARCSRRSLGSPPAPIPTQGTYVCINIHIYVHEKRVNTNNKYKMFIIILMNTR